MLYTTTIFLLGFEYCSHVPKKKHSRAIFVYLLIITIHVTNDSKWVKHRLKLSLRSLWAQMELHDIFGGGWSRALLELGPAQKCYYVLLR